MRKVFSLASFAAALAVVALLTFSFSGNVFAQGGTGTATPTTGTDTTATTGTDTTATTGTDTTATTGTDTTATTTTGTDTTATTTSDATTGSTTGGTSGTTGGTSNAPGSLPNTAEGDTGPLAPPIVFVLLLALIAGAVGFFSLSARRNAER